MSWLKTTLKRLNTWQVEALLLLLAALILLRIPNLAEPYWYGDEAIYLTIGNALSHGSQLYLDIVDHKTPLIYYLAMAPSQVWFRILFVGWMIVTTIAFYCVSLRFFKNVMATALATAFFILITTLPSLEGNIPNGELFVMGFVLVGGLILTKLPVMDRWLEDKEAQPMRALSDNLWLCAAGIFFGLGILTKVPGVFDLLGWLSLGWFGVWRRLWREPRRSWASHIGEFSRYSSLLGLSALLAVLASIVYFAARGAGQAYLDFGLLYNFRYAGSWSPSFTHPLIAVAFTLQGKVLLLGLAGISLTILTQKLKAKYAFIVFWLLSTLVAATLSNRPYPHYLLQLAPPLAFMVGWLSTLIMRRKRPGGISTLVTHLMSMMVPILFIIGTWISLGFYTYPIRSYYNNFWQLVTGQRSYNEYAERFNSSIRDNQVVTEILRSNNIRYLFIWGTNPLLYAQSQTLPTSRFTVAFHIKDFNDYERTLAEVKTRKPPFIVVMKDEVHTFPALNKYLDMHYMPNNNFDTLVLWKRWE